MILLGFLGFFFLVFFWLFLHLHLFLFAPVVLYRGREPFWTFSDGVGNLVWFGNEKEESLEALLQEIEFHVLVASPQEEIDLYPVPFFEPLCDPRGLQCKVVLAGADLDLDGLGLGYVRFCLDFPLLLLQLVLELTIVRYFSNGRICPRRDFNEVESFFFSTRYCLIGLHDT